MKKLSCVVVLAYVLSWPCLATAQDYLADGSKLNLCTLRGAVGTASSPTNTNYGGPSGPLHQAYLCEARFNAGDSDNAWWQVEFPSIYMVQDYDIQYYPGLYSSVEMEIQTSLDGVTWSTQSGVLTDTNGANGSLPNAVPAKFVRLNFLSFSGHPDMIVQVARLFGPNDTPIDPTISVAQSTWNNGSATYEDANHAAGTSAQTLVSDYTDGNWPGLQFAAPAKMTVKLAKSYNVEAVAISTIFDSRAPRNVEIYVSPDAEGDTWTFAGMGTDLPMTTEAGNKLGYHEIALDGTYTARRVRFDVTETWRGTDGYSAEVYVFGAPAETTPLRVTDFAVADQATGDASYTNSSVVDVTAFAAESFTADPIDGYFITDSATEPTLDSNWLPTPPSTYEFEPDAGEVTLYAYVKNTAGNISIAKTATITYSNKLPQVSNIDVSETQDNELTVTWDTDVETIGGVKYGYADGGAYLGEATEDALATSHSVTLTGLEDGAYYRIMIMSNGWPARQVYYPDMPVPTGNEYYADGSKINLATIRGNIATASSNTTDFGPAWAPLYPAYNFEARFTKGDYANAWWQVEFPQVYKVQNYSFWYFDAGLFSSIEAVVQTSLDGMTWTDQTGVLTDTVSVSGSFAEPVDAKFVRLNVLSYGGWSEMIIQGVKLTGPNDPPVTPNISVAQTTWNGGTVEVIDPALGTVQDDRLLTDLEEDRSFNDMKAGLVCFPNASGWSTEQPVEPTAIVVTLAKSYSVETIGIATIGDDRKPRDLDIYTSPDDTGDTWVLAKEVRDLPDRTGFSRLGYQEILLDQPIVAKRVKLEILRPYKTGSAGSIPECRLSEIYVYASPDTTATPVLDGDANGDCKVNIIDLIYIRNRLNQDPASGDNATADANSDGKINIIDLIYVRNRLNTRCE